MNCDCKNKQYTIKVTEGNAWQLLLRMKTAHWEGTDLITEDIDFTALADIAVTIDGEPWEFAETEDGLLLDIPADMKRGAHSVIVTAVYGGVEVAARYFECFTIVAWSFESDIPNYIPDAPQASELAYLFIGITDDEELEELKQQLRNSIAATETARLEYEAAKEAYDEKAEQLDDIAKETTLLQKSAAIIEAISGIHIDIPENIATKDDVTAATEAIMEALSHIQTDDPNSKALAQFFGLPESLPEYEAMTETEVKQMSDEVFAALYGHLAVTATMHYAVGGNDITSTIYPKYKRMVSAGQSGSEGTSSQGSLQDVTYGQQGFTHLYKMDEDTESQTYGQYVSCLDDVPQEGDVVYYLPNYNN